MLRRRLVRSAALHALVLATAASGLGLMAATPATASCAGPQPSLQQDGASIAPRRVGEGLDEQLLYDVERDRPLLVEGTNLTLGCNDTAAGTPGCDATPSAPPNPPPEPLRDAVLNFEQRGQRWTLASIDVGPDLRSTLGVRLPKATLPGKALLLITDPVNGDYFTLTLVLT